MRKSLKIIFANVIGTMLEYFDYALYGFSIPIIAPLFFPSTNQINSILLAWSTIVISLLIRPFAAVILGYYGDRIGRKKILRYTTLLMAFSTVLFGLIPTHSQIGILAPILLLLCRIIQGFAVSAEYNGSCIYLIEAFSSSKAFAASTVVFACGFGVMIASLLILGFVSSNTYHIMYFDLWRIPFIIGGILVGSIGFSLINGIPESKVFLASKNKNRLLKNPFHFLFKSQKLVILKTMFLSGYVGTITYILTFYLFTHLQIISGMNVRKALVIVIIGNFLGNLAAPIFGLITDAKGHEKVMLSSLIITILSSVPGFVFFQTHNTMLITISISIICISNAAFCASFASFLPGLFQSEIRYSGMGLSFNLGAAFMGGLAPMVITFLTELTKSALVPGIYMMIFALLSFLILRRTIAFDKLTMDIDYAKSL